MANTDTPTNPEILRSRRRTLALHIRPDGRLLVRAPRFTLNHQISRFIRENLLWIEKTRQKVLERRRLADGWRAQFPHEDGHYKEQARVLFAQRCELYASRMGVSYERIALSNASTRWGSCSPKGNLRFNWRLVMAPSEVIDYVIVHELAHLKELNHSRRFWALVEAVLPSYRASKKWLREHPL